MKKENNSKIIKIVEYNEELIKNSEKSIDNNYKNFNITKMNTILTFDITDIRTIIFILKDGRLLVYGSRRNRNNFKSIVYNLKSNNYINMNIEKIYGIIQMDDGIVIILTEKGLRLKTTALA